MNDLKKRVKELNNARTQYNPLRSLTVQRVVSLLEQGELGNYVDLQWTYRMIEKRDAVLRALVRRRSAALLKLNWDIKQIPEEDLPKGFTPAQAEAQALALRELYDNIKNLKGAIKALALAEFRGFAMLQKTYKGKAALNPEQIDSLDFIKQWFWTRNGLEGEWLFDERLTGSYRSAEEVDPKTLIIREVEDPIDEIGLIAFIRKNMSQKDWDAFVEVFGIPDIFFTMPQGMTKDQMDEWLLVAEQLAGDGRGALPYGGDVKAVGGDVRGTNPFKEHLDYQDTMMVLAGTGGKLTMLSEATGIGGGATDAHEDAFDDLAQAEAFEISELFQEHIDLPLLNTKFPGQLVLAYFEIAAEDQENTNALIDNALKLYQAGIEIDVDDLAERTGYSLTRINKMVEGTQTPSAGNQQDIEGNYQDEKIQNRRWHLPRLFNRATKDLQAELKKNARGAIAQAIKMDLRPVAIRVAEILDNTDDEDLEAALTEFRDRELPELLEQIADDPGSTDAYADMLTASYFNGLEEG